MSLVVRPISPQSRRSSYVSTGSLYNNALHLATSGSNNNYYHGGHHMSSGSGLSSNVMHIYSKQYVKKQNSFFKLARVPMPSNQNYKKTLFLALLFPFLATLLFVGVTQMVHEWESVSFKFDKLLDLFSIGHNCSIGQINEPTNGHAYVLKAILFDSGYIWTRNDSQLSKQSCRSLSDRSKIDNIVGVLVINRDIQVNNQSANSSRTTKLDKSRLLEVDTKTKYDSVEYTIRNFNQNKYTLYKYKNSNVKMGSQRTASASGSNDRRDYFFTSDEANPNVWFIGSIQAGIWSICYDLSESNQEIISNYLHKNYPNDKLNVRCVSYLQANISETKNTCTQFLLKMQNNIISCVVVVYLSIIASILIGTCSTILRTVPAAMVTGVLYVTSGVFIIFANCIHHTKINRLENEWGACYPISNLPTLMYNPDLITIELLWPVLVSWVSSFVFFVASIIWIVFTQLMTVENSKIMI